MIPFHGYTEGFNLDIDIKAWISGPNGPSNYMILIINIPEIMDMKWIYCLSNRFLPKR